MLVKMGPSIFVFVLMFVSFGINISLGDYVCLSKTPSNHSCACTSSPPQLPRLPWRTCDRPSTPNTSEILLFCGEEFMWVDIPLHLLTESSDTHLRFQDQTDQACQGVIDTNKDGLDVMRLKTSLEGCGTNRTESDNYEIYMNVIEDYSVGLISRQKRVEIQLKCNYNRSARVAVTYRLTDYVLDKQLSAMGHYKFDLRFFADSNYSVPISTYPYKVRLDQELFYAASLSSTAYDNLDLSIKSCRATTTSNYDEGPSIIYDFIKNWTVITEEDGSTEVTCSSSPPHVDSVRVKTRAFRFVGGSNGDTVYVHCDLFVCNAAQLGSICKSQCESATARRKRDIMENLPALPIQRVTRGPIILERGNAIQDTRQDSLQGKDQFSSKSLYVLLGVVTGVFVIVVVGIILAFVVTMRKLSHARPQNRIVQDNDVTEPLLEQ